MHSSRVEKVPTESQGDEAPIIHSVQAPSAEVDVARESGQQSVATAMNRDRLVSGDLSGAR